MTDNEKLDKRRYIKFTQKDGWLHKKCPECNVGGLHTKVQEVIAALFALVSNLVSWKIIKEEAMWLTSLFY